MVADAYRLDQENETHFFETRRSEKRLRGLVGKDLLASLQFETQRERYEGVVEAHERTFDWIYQENQNGENQWDSFVDWLTRGEGLYWINGKAGSGKSTLMRYICENRLTQNYLSIWAEGSKLYTAKFFFWNLGTRLQKSQIGLLRSLLYEILIQIPELIPIVFPEQWAGKYASESLSWESKVSKFHSSQPHPCNTSPL